MVSRLPSTWPEPSTRWPWPAASAWTPTPGRPTCCAPMRPASCSTAAGSPASPRPCATKAVHVAVYEPGSLILLLSPSQRQSGELFRKVAAVYKSLGRPVPSEGESALTLTLENGSPHRLPAGHGGHHPRLQRRAPAHRDEAARVPDDAIAAVRPMLAVSGGQLIALSTPDGRRGWWYEAWEDGGAAWRARAHPRRVPADLPAFLAEERASMGDCFYARSTSASFAESDAQLISEET